MEAHLRPEAQPTPVSQWKVWNPGPCTNSLCGRRRMAFLAPTRPSTAPQVSRLHAHPLLLRGYELAKMGPPLGSSHRLFSPSEPDWLALGPQGRCGRAWGRACPEELALPEPRSLQVPLLVSLSLPPFLLSLSPFSLSQGLKSLCTIRQRIHFPACAFPPLRKNWQSESEANTWRKP